MPDVLDFDQLSPKQKLALQRALLRMAHEETAAPTEPDLTAVPVYMVTHDAENVRVYRIDGEHLIDKDGNKVEGHDNMTRCPETKARLGHAPVAYNGVPILTYEDHIGLRTGDAKTLEKFTPHNKQEVA